MAKRRYMQAVNDALFEEMERDPRVIVFGEDVELAIFGDTRGLRDRFGRDRVRNTPICEATLTGMAVGAALAGYRVVLHMMFANFIYTGFDAIANQMAKFRLMTGGQVRLPITVMAGYGGGTSSAAQHADTPYPLLMNLGGINVLTPSCSADAKGLLKQAIRSDDPCFFLEARLRGGELSDVPDEADAIPFGTASLLREGGKATVVAIGTMVRPALEAADLLSREGIDVDLIDPRTLVPFDEAAVLRSVGKTGRLVVVDEARDRCSAASQIAAMVADKAFDALKAPVKRLTVPDVALPYAPNCERHLLPSAASIASAVRTVMEWT